MGLGHSASATGGAVVHTQCGCRACVPMVRLSGVRPEWPVIGEATERREYSHG